MFCEFIVSKNRLFRRKPRSISPDYKVNPLHFLPGITIKGGKIARSQALHLSLPPGIGNLNAQHPVRKFQSSCALGNHRPAN